MARTVLVAVKDLLFGSKIDAAAKRIGLPLQWSPRFEKLGDVAVAKRPDTIIAALDEPGTLEELKRVRAELPDVRIVGFAGHVQVYVLREARALGIDEVLTKGQFAASVEQVLAREQADEA